MRRLILFLLFFVMIGAVHAQFTYGTTGLLNMPTADMQRDKTFMFGGGFLEKHATPARWTYNTFNYYLDITIFPWLEVSYICTLHKAMEVDPAYGPGFWVPSTRMGSLSTRTVILRYVYGCGKKAGGNRGLRKLYWVRMTFLIIHGQRVARLR